MDVLLILEAAPVPERIFAASRRVMEISYGPIPPETIADLRAHIPRSVGLIAPTTLRAGRG